MLNNDLEQKWSILKDGDYQKSQQFGFIPYPVIEINGLEGDRLFSFDDIRCLIFVVLNVNHKVNDLEGLEELEIQGKSAHRIDDILDSSCKVYHTTSSKMDEYDKKFAEIQKYIPFLEVMIELSENLKDKSREVQLQKMRSLHRILSSSKRKLKMETLLRCEDVLQKLRNKVKKGNTPGLHFPNKKSKANSAQSSSAIEEAATSQPLDEIVQEREIHGTPANLSPPVSHDLTISQMEPTMPTERRMESDKSTTFNTVEALSTKALIIRSTERITNDHLVFSSSSQRSSSKSDDVSLFTEWDMLEENKRVKNWQRIVTCGHSVVSTMKLVDSNVAQIEGRGHMPISISTSTSMHPSRRIPTIPVSGFRKSSLLSKKNRLLVEGNLDVSSDSKPKSPIIVLSDTGLKSPDSKSFYMKDGKNASPKTELVSTASNSSKQSMSLLLSSLPVPTEPPLSMKDLAELLNEEGDNITNQKGDTAKTEKDKLDNKEDEQDVQKVSAVGGSDKEGKQSKPFLLTQEDVKSESEMRWEKIDKHVVELASRKCLPTTGGVVAEVDALKSNKNGGPLPVNSVGHNWVVNNRIQSVTPGSKAETRFADNYGGYPRNHSHEKGKPIVPYAHRPNDDDIFKNPLLDANSAKSEERNAMLYQKRQEGNVWPPEIVPTKIDTEFRTIEGSTEYFNREVLKPAHWPPSMHHPPLSTNVFCNSQWPQTSSFNTMPHSSAQSYQYQIGMHQEMWNTDRGPIHMDPHQLNEAQLRPNQFPLNINTISTVNSGIRPSMTSLNAPFPQDINHISRSNDTVPFPIVNILNVPTTQPFISPTRFPVAPVQYKVNNFQVEDKSYWPSSFDRGDIEYPHQRQFSSSPNNIRSNEMLYRSENEVPFNVVGPMDGPVMGSYPKSSTPCLWNRDTDRGEDRGWNSYYNERNRRESRNNFNRDPRRLDWRSDNNHEWDNCNRFGKDVRSTSDRDPRIRKHDVINQSANQLRDNDGTLARYPRLAKDKHFLLAKGEDISFNKRNLRKQSKTESFASSMLLSSLLSSRRSKEKPKSSSKPPDDNHTQTGSKNFGKQQLSEKSIGEKMQSPLETLYGIINTKAKSAQGYCLQNFKIPKINHESLESLTSSHASDGTMVTEGTGKQENKSTERNKNDAEESSSRSGNIQSENWNDSADGGGEQRNDSKDDLPPLPLSLLPLQPPPLLPFSSSTTAFVSENTMNLNIAESDFIDIITCCYSKGTENTEKTKTDYTESAEGPKSKDEVLQQCIEALIRKIFEFGEAKNYVRQAKFMQKLVKVLQTKKPKKIKKIIRSEFESSSSDNDDSPDAKKSRTRRKRRIIISDSSDEESVIGRLDILKAKRNKCSFENPSVNDDRVKKVGDSRDIGQVAEVSQGRAVPRLTESSKNEFTERENENVSLTRIKEDKFWVVNREKVEENGSADVPKDMAVKNESVYKKENVIDKTAKVKRKRRNSLEMLQQDIREMFIGRDVVATTGHRLHRSKKVKQSNAANQSTSSANKDEVNKRDNGESYTEDTSLFDFSRKQKKSVKSRALDKFVTKSLKAKCKKGRKRINTRQRSKRYQSEGYQPLALRTTSTEEARNDNSNALRRSKRIKLQQKDAPKIGLSIIDKLNDKMKTNLVANNETDINGSIESPSNALTTSMSSPPTNLIPSEKSTIELLLNCSSTAAAVDNFETNLPLSRESCSDLLPAEDSAVVSKANLSSRERNSHFASRTGSQIYSEVADALVTFDQKKKNNESDVETKDNENTRRSREGSICDFESSNAQSYNEPPTDVNVILKETFNSGTPTKDSLLAIRGLTAQLQGIKPRQVTTEEKSKFEQPRRAFVWIPKPPYLLPIAGIKKFTGRLEKKFYEISLETNNDNGSPENFTKLKCLSRDMSISIPSSCSQDVDESQPNTSSNADSTEKADEEEEEKEEECSFLKIENVVSLAPRINSDGVENPIINDIRKALEVSPAKSAGRVREL